jgi:membrane protease YdiL (CAAX protease family)
MKKVGKFLGCFLPIIVALLCQVAISFGFSIGYGVYVGIKMTMLGITDVAEQEAYMAENMSSGNVILIITAIATAVTLLVGALWYRKHKPTTDLKLKETVNGKILAAMACFGLSLQFLISMCLSAVYPILPQDLTDQYSELMESLLGGNVWLSLFVTVILAPLAEELLFRGVTMKKAQKIMPFMAANVLQAVLFGIYHMNWIQGVYAFVLGMILGFTAEYFHSIWASILLHAFVNGSAEVLSLLPEAVTETAIGNIGIAVAGVVLLFVAAKLYPLARKEPVAIAVAAETAENEMFTENSFDE